MHRNFEVADIELDAFHNIKSIKKLYAAEHLPVGTLNGSEAERKALANWWSRRTIPKGRPRLQEVLDIRNMLTSKELLKEGFGLSLSDQYWLKPQNSSVFWEQIQFFDNNFSEQFGEMMLGNLEITEDIDTITPDVALEGRLEKAWKSRDGKRVLIKGGSNPYQQEPLCEVIASRIADRLCIPHTEYTLLWEHEKPFSVCQDFITSETELVSSYHIMQSRTKPKELSEYEFYLNCAEQLGVKNIREQTEKMIVLDFLIGNEDRHFNNFGLIRNAVTLEWIGVAPIFDCGTSLWHDTQEGLVKPISPNLPAKPFKKTHREQIKLVKDFLWLDMKKLYGMEDEMEEILSLSAFISKERREVLCDAFSQRVKLLEEIANENTVKDGITQENDIIF